MERWINESGASCCEKGSGLCVGLESTVPIFSLANGESRGLLRVRSYAYIRI